MTAEPSAADLRAVAVAKLKRAASLPRMKDGRRPPMRDDAVVSEGDRATGTPGTPPEDQAPVTSENATDADPVVELTPPTTSPSMKADDSAIITEDEPSASGRETPSKRRRGRSRSRSRSRSRGSKDFRDAAKADAFRPVDSSPEEIPPMPGMSLFAPTLASPIPSHFSNMQSAARNLGLLNSSHPFFPAYPITSPPTLEAIAHNHLKRSHSARQQTMDKLLGVRGSPTTPTPSTTPPPFAGLGRSNTVTGVDRVAVRNQLLKRLEQRKAPTVQEGLESEAATDIDSPSVRKASNQSPPLFIPPQAQRASPSMPHVIDDRDLPGSPVDSPQPHSSGLPNLPLRHVSSTERKHQETLAKLTGDDPFEFDSTARRTPQVLPLVPQRGPVIEEDDDVHGDLPPAIPRLAHHSPSTSSGSHSSHLRALKVSEVSSTSSVTGTDLERVPVFLQEEGQKSPYAQDTFPVQISPLGTPSRDRGQPLEDDTTDDDVVYQKAQTHAETIPDAKLSWIGDNGINLNTSQAMKSGNVPDPLLEESSDDLESEPKPNNDESTTSVIIDEPTTYSQSIQAPSSSVPQVELSPVQTVASSDAPDPSHVTRMSHDGYSSSIIPQTPSTTDAFERRSASEKPSEDDLPPPALNRASSASSSSMAVPEKSLVTPVRTDRGNSDIYSEWEDGQTDAAQTDREGLTDYEGRPERSPSRLRKKRDSGKEGGSRWEKLKNFTRPRSRSNSFARARRDESGLPSPHRDSAASGKSDQSGPAAPSSSAQPVQHTLTSSASLLSLAASPVPRPREGSSPMPPMSDAIKNRYADPKLMPLPGLVRLEEQMRRTRKTSLAGTDAPTTVPNSRVNSPEPVLMHQASDSKLLARYRSSGEGSHPGDMTDYEDADGRITPAYFDLAPLSPRSPTPGAGPKAKLSLPQTREGALHWIQLHVGKAGKSSDNLTTGAISDSNTIRPGGGSRRKANTLSDLVRGADSGTEKEDRSANATPRPGVKRRALDQMRKMAGSPTETISVGPSISSTSSRSERPSDRISSDRISSDRPSLDDSIDEVRRTNGHMSTTSTSSSISDNNLSPTLGQFPTTPPLNLAIRTPVSPTTSITPTTPIKSAMAKPPTPRTPALMQEFNALIDNATGTTSDPFSLGPAPRRFINHAIVRQVVSPNEVKNRFLLLFNDILVVAKFHPDDFTNPIMDRRLLVRNVVDLQSASLQLPRTRSHQEYMALPSIQTLVRDFTTRPEDALSRCIQKTGLSREPATIASLLFRTTGLDPSALAEYLARRSNKAVLKSFLDRFSFKGMRIDIALRFFLLTIRMPKDTHQTEHLLASFASRWYEANQGEVTFDRELSMKLVVAMMQLNNILHGQDFNANSLPAHDFISEFQEMDPLSLVTDDLLHRVYLSIRNDRLIQGLEKSEQDQQIPITFTPPPTLVSRVPSTSITVRIPRPDPFFCVHLYGHNLSFNRSSLDFSRSNEASFVITGNVIGKREMLFVRTGANAARYASLPSSCTISVERPFMPNTFTLSFPATKSFTSYSPNAPVRQRSYRFNVVDENEHQVWVRELERLVGGSRSSSGSSHPSPQRAVDVIALQALRDALVDPGDENDREDVDMLPNRLVQPTATAANKADKGRPEPMKLMDLVSACEQNSLIPAMLTYLQTTRPVSNGEGPKPFPTIGDLRGPSATVARNGSRLAGRI
ncbi:hypothetical protein DL93DRAFT_2162983 [Clavulina sp. PMI_390]|nr:hypothetical protein DL93DRAFT_2162983 [Clavulina sp. PMI_390]